MSSPDAAATAAQAIDTVWHDQASAFLDEIMASERGRELLGERGLALPDTHDNLPKHENVWEAKAAVQREVRWAAKRTSKGLSYSYSSDEDIIAALNPFLAKHGLTLDAIDITTEKESDYKSKQGTAMRLLRLKVKFLLSHGASKTNQEIVAFGEGADSGDKCSYKCMTGAYKYALWMSFVLARGEDPDKTGSAQQEAADDRPRRDDRRRGNDRPQRPQREERRPDRRERRDSGGEKPSPKKGGDGESPFEHRKKIVAKAKDLETLEKFREKYRHDGLCSDQEIEALDKVAHLRERELNRKEAQETRGDRPKGRPENGKAKQRQGPPEEEGPDEDNGDEPAEENDDEPTL